MTGGIELPKNENIRELKTWAWFKEEKIKEERKRETT